MITTQTSLLQHLMQWFETGFAAPDGLGSRQDLTVSELADTLDVYGVLIRTQNVSDVQQLRGSVAGWTAGMRTQVTGLLRRLNQKPLTQINRLLEDLVQTCRQQPTEEGQLHDLLDGSEKWQAKITRLAQRLKNQAAEVHAWQVIAKIARDLDRANQDSIAPELNTQAMRQFTQRVTDLLEAIGDMQTRPATIDSLDFRSVPKLLMMRIRRARRRL